MVGGEGGEETGGEGEVDGVGWEGDAGEGDAGEGEGRGEERDYLGGSPPERCTRWRAC